MRVSLQYLFQGWGYRGPDKYRDMITSTATEEIGHIEVLATAVTMNLEGAKSEQVDEVVTNPLVAARMGALDPRHFLTAGLAAMPSDANGVPFNAACIDVGGNLIANMRANVAAEAIGRTLACRLLEMTDDPGMKDLLRFLIARDTMHQQQWLAVLEELRPELATNAPGDFENTDEFADHAYNFIDQGSQGGSRGLPQTWPTSSRRMRRAGRPVRRDDQRRAARTGTGGRDRSRSQMDKDQLIGALRDR